jgi:hypothetical protein
VPDEPVFSEADRVAAANATLPTELQGKSVAEVAAYYQQRETRLQADLRTAQAAVPVAPVSTVKVETPKNEDFWTNPSGAVQAAVKAGSVSREEFANASAWVQRQMTEIAEFLVAQKHEDWKVFKADIDDIMSKIEPAARADSNMWETAYIYARGRNPEKAVKAQTSIISTTGVERGAPAAATVTATEVQLTSEQEFVRSRMGITKEAYIEAQGHITRGTFPLTFDNRDAGRR